MSASNRFEQLARAKKVSALLAIVPHGNDAREIAATAAFLSAMTDRQWATLAQRAGVSVPSEETRRLVLAKARARLSVGEIVAMAGGTR